MTFVCYAIVQSIPVAAQEHSGLLISLYHSAIKIFLSHVFDTSLYSVSEITRLEHLILQYNDADTASANILRESEFSGEFYALVTGDHPRGDCKQ